MLEDLFSNLLATSWIEALAVALGLAYSLLAVKQNRWCWVAGGLSSGLFIYLAASARLPMQAGLQGYYVLMAFYGWHNWSRQASSEGHAQAISTWPLRYHLLALGCALGASAGTAHWLARETHAAWPYLDSATTAISLIATFLVARMKLENWVYWIAADGVMVFLFVAQGLAFSAALFGAYLCISTVGLVTWWRKYRLQPQLHPA